MEMGIVALHREENRYRCKLIVQPFAAGQCRASRARRVYERDMRNLSSTMLALAAALVGALVAAPLAACGPSGKQVAMAKQARYQGERQQIFAVIKQTVASDHKIIRVDDAAYGLQTEGRWYNLEGQVLPAPPNSLSGVPDQSLLISLTVAILPEGERHIVSVKPLVMRYHKGRLKPDPVEETDPRLPGWVHEKGDNTQVSLYNALKPYEVQVTGGAAPAAGPPAASPLPPTTTPTPDPVGPTVTPPPPQP
jgi:hypothetical protein